MVEVIKKEIRETFPERLENAIEQLPALVQREKVYIMQTTDKLAQYYSFAEKALQSFSSSLIFLIDIAYHRASHVLQKYKNANDFDIHLGPNAEKTYHIFPLHSNIVDYVSAHKVGDRWLYALVLHDIATKTKFPRLIRIPKNVLIELLSGWRASDETSNGYKAMMCTTQLWQLYLWSALRSGPLVLIIPQLNLNKKFPTFGYLAVSSYPAFPKNEAIVSSPLSTLMWVLGDGSVSVKGAPRVTVQHQTIPLSVKFSPMMVETATKAGISTLLDILDVKKWKNLKNAKPKQSVFVTFLGLRFYLHYSQRRKRIRARATIKDPSIQSLFFQLNLRFSVSKKYPGYSLDLPMVSVLQLAENYQEWRRAIKELAQKHNIQPVTPSLKRLLELAENPTPPFLRFSIRLFADLGWGPAITLVQQAGITR